MQAFFIPGASGVCPLHKRGHDDTSGPITNTRANLSSDEANNHWQILFSSSFDRPIGTCMASPDRDGSLIVAFLLMVHELLLSMVCTRVRRLCANADKCA